MLEWMAETCDCCIIVDVVSGDFVYRDWIQKCPKHKDLSGDTLLSTVHTHHKSIVEKQGFIDIPQTKLRRIQRSRLNKRAWAVRENDTVLLAQLDKLDAQRNDIKTERETIRTTGTIEKNPLR